MCVCSREAQQQGAVGVEDERVKELLGRVNGMDMDVVFSPRKEPLVPPRYQLMTRDQLTKASLSAKRTMDQVLPFYLLHTGPR